MISRRNFIMLTLLMFVLLGLFMFTEAAKQKLNDYGTNPYANQVSTEDGSDTGYQVTEDTTGTYCVYIGTSQDFYQVVYQWSTYHQSNLISVSSCSAYTIDTENLPEFIIVQGSQLTAEDIPMLGQWIGEGANLIFADMPTEELIDSSEELQDYLGIQNLVMDQVEVNGITLHKGFLLGGDGDYVEDTQAEEGMQDLDVSIPWYTLQSGTEVYMNGTVDADLYIDTFGQDTYEKYPNAYLPGILWRVSIGDARVFVVNGDYLSTDTGIGLLYAMEYQMTSYQLYPVVNAQSTVITAYPSFADENSAELQEIYARSATEVMRDLVWPSLVEIMTKTNSKMTFMLQSQLQSTSGNIAQEDNLTYFMQLLGTEETEAGLNASGISDIGTLAQLQQDKELYDSCIPDYAFTTAYAGSEDVGETLQALQQAGYENVATLLRDYEDTQNLFDWQEGTLVLSTVNMASSHTYSEDLRTRSMETAFAYSLISEDLSRVLYPEEDQDQWQNLSKKMASYCTTYFSHYDAFEEVTLSIAGERVRQYLNSTYDISRQGQTISLTCEGGSGYYILRTHNEEIQDISGASYQEIEDGAYLLTIESKKVEITLEKTSQAIYYED